MVDLGDIEKFLKKVFCENFGKEILKRYVVRESWFRQIAQHGVYRKKFSRVSFGVNSVSPLQ